MSPLTLWRGIPADVIRPAVESAASRLRSASPLAVALVACELRHDAWTSFPPAPDGLRDNSGLVRSFEAADARGEIHGRLVGKAAA